MNVAFSGCRWSHILAALCIWSHRLCLLGLMTTPMVSLACEEHMSKSSQEAQAGLISESTSSPSHQPPPPHGQSSIRIVPNVIHVGRVKPDDTQQSASFEIHNIGPEPRRITRSLTTCGCTVADVPKHPIEPATSVVASVKMRVAHGSKSQHTITLVIEGEDEPVRLVVYADGTPAVVTEPERLIIQSDTSDIRIRSTTGVPFQIIDMDPPLASVPSTPSSTHHLIIDHAAWTMAGSPRLVRFRLDHPEQSQLEVRVSDAVVAAHSAHEEASRRFLHLVPRRLEIGRINVGDTKTHKLLIRNVTLEEACEIRLTCEDAAVQIAIQHFEAAEQGVLFTLGVTAMSETNLTRFTTRVEVGAVFGQATVVMRTLPARPLEHAQHLD